MADIGSRLSDNQNYKLELVLDILSSCHWSCTGCIIPKKENVFSIEELKGLEEKFLFLQSQGNRLNHLEFGPVDFLSSANFEAVFSSPTILRLLNCFEEIFLTSKFLDFSKLSFFTNALQKSDKKKVNIFYPVERKEILNEGFFESFNLSVKRVKEALDRFVTKLTIYPVLTELELLKNEKELLYLFDAFKKETDLDLSVNTTCTRVSNSFEKGNLRTLKLLKKGIDFTERTKQSSNSNNDQGLIKRGFIFSNNKLFFMPYVHQFIPCLTKDFLVDQKKLLEFDKNLELSQALTLHEKLDCMECSNLKSCLDRGVLSLMDVLGLKNCIFSCR